MNPYDLYKYFISTPGATLTWYGEERVELSGPVMGRWFSKISTLISEETSTPAQVAIALPPHWRSALWALGTWATQSTLIAEPDLTKTLETDFIDLLVVCDEAHFLTNSASLILAQPLDALSLSWPGELPPGIEDGPSAVMSRPDTPGILPEFSFQLFSNIPESSLPTAPFTPAPKPVGRRDLTAHNLSQYAVQCAKIWVSGGTVVLFSPDLSEKEKERIREIEKSTPWEPQG